ncbi:hypothetical protein GF354_05715 [Candidatus Peregrinibacteria bacterium]|nr:hypothetical protein [Candidatus Peregrinibacteria bacterium]
MISSLLSLYIASSIQPNLSAEINESELQSISVSAVNEEKKTIKKNEFVSPVIYAEGVIAMDLNSDTILFEKNLHEKRAIASITKLMTALIILEENNIYDIVTISQNAANIEGSQMYLRAGEKITIENLIYGIMIQSANDAAYALAEYNAGSVSAFVEKMNKKASILGLINTNFANPAGLDNPHNYSTPFDIAKLAKTVYQKPLIQVAANTKEMQVNSVKGGLQHKLTNTNKLLDSYLHIKGLKTGKTNSAGLCLVAIGENNGNNIITVVLNSPDRFKESKILIDWVFRAYNWI